MWSAAFTGSGGAGEADDELAPDDDALEPNQEGRARPKGSRGRAFACSMGATTGARLAAPLRASSSRGRLPCGALGRSFHGSILTGHGVKPGS